MTASVFGQNPEDIEREIRHTREELERTLDALQAKLSPRRRLEEAVDTARDAVGTVRSSGRRIANDLQDRVRRDPVPFIAIGGLLLVAIVAGALIQRRPY
jgi:hypothetical protein